MCWGRKIRHLPHQAGISWQSQIASFSSWRHQPCWRRLTKEHFCNFDPRSTGHFKNEVEKHSQVFGAGKAAPAAEFGLHFKASSTCAGSASRKTHSLVGCFVKRIPVPGPGSHTTHAGNWPCWELLLASAKGRNSRMEGHRVHSEEPDKQAALWEQTLKEQQRGFLKGPFDSLQQVKHFLKSDTVVINRRFVLLQGEKQKPRAIDDCKSSGVNSAYSTVDKLVLEDLDYYTALATLAGKAVTDRQVKIPLTTGENLVGVLHPQFTSPPEWLGRCIDLEKAYRQVPVSSHSLKFCVLLVHDPNNQPKYFLSQSLPFGACASVYSFNRISKSLLFLIRKILFGVGCVFYDDFPFLETRATASMFSSTVSKLLKLLGWRFAQDGDKAEDFCSSFVVLGAQVDVSRLHLGELVIQNKPGRIERINRLIEAIKLVWPPRKRDLQVLVGLLQYSTGLCLGTALRIPCRAFTALAYESIHLRRDAFVNLCNWTLNVLAKLQPKRLRTVGTLKPILVFTDASFEQNVARWGIVIIDSITCGGKVFEGQVPEALVKVWQTEEKLQVICEAESFAVLLARHQLSAMYPNRKAIFWVDNEASRMSLIKGTSNTFSLMSFAHEFHLCSEADSIQVWVERVPSASNIADLPSRQLSGDAAKLIGGTFEKCQGLPFEVMQRLLGYKSLEECAKAYAPRPSFRKAFDPVADDLIRG